MCAALSAPTLHAVGLTASSINKERNSMEGTHPPPAWARSRPFTISALDVEWYKK